jgi:hypothetical protein
MENRYQVDGSLNRPSGFTIKQLQDRKKAIQSIEHKYNSTLLKSRELTKKISIKELKKK